FQEEASWVDYQQRNSYNQNQRFQNPSPRWNEQGKFDSRNQYANPNTQQIFENFINDKTPYYVPPPFRNQNQSNFVPRNNVPQNMNQNQNVLF
ncbi:hypothetical protein ABFV55_27540, partial [Pseudomonas syringae]|uniref:hypothetical protein n=1 Tax=Pseudomonas syringae TaxID=317 RepID=UPI0034D95BF4